MNFDIGQIISLIGLTALLFQIVRKYFETEILAPQWDSKLNFAWIPLSGLIVVINILRLKFLSQEYPVILLIGLCYFIYKYLDYKSPHLIFIAIFPYIIIHIFNLFFVNITPEFYNNYASNFSVARKSVVLWLFGFGTYIFRQNKRDNILRQKEADERKILEDQKNSLENLVTERTVELTKQKEALEKAFVELKATQNQLIQSEKLASLGELTAGIAHEIQNPLNFVNNFAEISVDLAKDINTEIHKQVINKDYLEELLTDLTHNQEKINLHGKRASNIVKGMLEHSRTSTGVKELTNINKLCDEYFRLAYHGLRAKDKSFNCELISNFDDTLPNIEIIPQDIGRVILNLINNAFYAVNERSKNLQGSDAPQYQPKVTVSTQKNDNSIAIRIKDNGVGISESVKEKIFQPFFTTKPTGSGTGLGLSLAYDIITKGHSGTLKVESTQGIGSEFIIQLPLHT